MEGKTIQQWKEEGILIIAVNNPPANAYTHEMLRDLDQCILEARFDDSVGVIVLTSKVEHFFSAGGDLKVLDDKSVPYKYNFALHGQEVLTHLRNTPKLIIAAINGHAIGGGLELALATDIRIAKRDGGRLGLTEVNLGVMPGMGGSQMLTRLVGKQKALELIFLGRQFSFEEGLELGVVHYIFEKLDYLDRVLQFARQFLPLTRDIAHLKQRLYHHMSD